MTEEQRAAIREHAHRIAANAPPLTEQQKRDLARILGGRR